MIRRVITSPRSEHSRVTIVGTTVAVLGTALVVGSTNVNVSAIVPTLTSVVVKVAVGTETVCTRYTSRSVETSLCPLTRSNPYTRVVSTLTTVSAD